MSDNDPLAKAFDGLGALSALLQATTQDKSHNQDLVEIAPDLADLLMAALAQYLEVTPTGAEITVETYADYIGNSFSDLGFARYRCYVSDGVGSKRWSMYDTVVLTWEGSPVQNPRTSWAGDPRQWVGMRPVKNDAIQAIEPGQQVKSVHGLEVCKPLRKADPTAQVGWAATYSIKPSLAQRFIEESAGLIDGFAEVVNDNIVRSTPLLAYAPGSLRAIGAGTSRPVEHDGLN